MANYGPAPIKWSFTAASDLSAKQFTFVKLSAASTVAACSAATDKPVGILENAPTAGQIAEVTLTGICKVVAGAALTYGTQVGTDTSGRAVALVAGTDTTKYVVGTVLDGGNTGAGGIITIAIDCVSPNRAA